MPTPSSEPYSSLLPQLRARVPGRVAVAYSGGLDSSFLLKLLVDALGVQRVLALTAVSPSLAASERGAARGFAAALGVEHVELETHELERPDYRKNATDRCYHCKDELFRAIAALREVRPIEAVVYGAILDDLGEHRPGMDAARAHGVAAPLIELGLSKERIRALSRELGLRTAEKPAQPCLASRIPYGQEVTAERLAAIEAAEAGLHALGFRVLRVRHHGDIARLELAAAELPRLLDGALRAEVLRRVRAAGFRYATVDLEPFRSGRLNDAIKPERNRTLPLATASALVPQRSSP